MVQNVIEPFDVDIIKVTIKRIKNESDLRGQESEANLKEAFKVLKQYAHRQRKIRDSSAAISERNLKRELRHYFDTWYDRSKTQRKVSANTQADNKMSNEKRIELLINVIAEKQKEIVATVDQKADCTKHPLARTKSVSINGNNQENKEKQIVSGFEKAKNCIKDAAKNRLEAQKAIIQEQKAKLTEQSRFIQDLQLKEIDKEAKRASKQTINVAKQALNQCDPQTRRSIIHLMREEGCRDKSIIEIPRIPDPPEFLKKMETRAEARKQRIKQAIELRQRKREEEKQIERINKQKAEEEKRQKEVQALLDMQRLRKEKEARRIKNNEKIKKLESLADQCYKKYLFRRYAVDPLTRLVEEKYKCLKRADEHYEETLLVKIFSAWNKEYLDQRKVKLQLANKLYRHNLLWYVFDNWKSITLEMKEKSQLAATFYDERLQRKYVKAWSRSFLKMKAIICEQEVKAVKHYEKHVKRIYFDLWKRYIALADNIKQKEERRDEWRDLIRKFIPDTVKMRKFSLES